jgi:hypothetical protein
VSIQEVYQLQFESNYHMDQEKQNRRVSSTLLTVLVTEIGCKSLSTVHAGIDFCKGVTLAIFQSSGTVPCLNEQLIIDASGAERMYERCLRIILDKPPGPTDLLNLSRDNFLLTSST